MIAIGVGCRKACPADDILALVQDALTQWRLAQAQPETRALKAMPSSQADQSSGGALRPAADVAIQGLFTLADKRGERGLEQAAVRLGLPLVFLDKAVLRTAAGGARSRSARIESLHGLPSIAETAALAGAGLGAILLVPRRASATATCAIAGQPQ